MDYFATGKLDLEVSTQVVRGIATACKEARIALIGGETAEMPGVYADGVYDLAGFAVGEVMRKDWINGEQAAPGQTLVGIRSSGFHSNGYSLVRALLGSGETMLKQQLLTPTRLYTRVVMDLLNDQRDNITGIAHITGGGFHNIPRINEKLGYLITRLPSDVERPAAMNEILKRANLPEDKQYETFNMGIGMVFSVKDAPRALKKLEALGEQPIVLGQTTDQFTELKIEAR